MKEYHKINSVYARDPESKKIMLGVFSTPEIEFLHRNKWIFTEKIDGTNIRISPVFPVEGPPRLKYGGRTENAQIPAKLVEALDALLPWDNFAKCFEGQDLVPITLYGEGYGAGIQSGGIYRPDQSFILFDVLYGDIWLERKNVEDIAGKLGIPVVPIIGEGTLTMATTLCNMGFASKHCLDRSPDAPPPQAEGLVARPSVEMRDRRGSRIITKLKIKDFVALNEGAKKASAQ